MREFRLKIATLCCVGTSACLLALATSAGAQDAAAPPVAADTADAGDAGAPVNEPADAGPAADASATPDAGVDDAAARAKEEAEIAAELARTPSGQPPVAEDTPTAPAESSGATASSRGLSNLMNPAISAAGIALGGATSRREGAPAAAPGDLRTGLFVQEVELRASAIVDPYFRADISLAGNADGVGFEEAYITTLDLPLVAFRVGQMRAAVGRHNILHTHAFPFITAPLPWRALLGPDGLSDPGVSADVLVPLPFFLELNAQVFQGAFAPLEGSIADDPATPFVDESVPDQRRDRDLAYVGHLKTLFDVSDSTTLELGGSYVGGQNGFGGWTSVAGGDLTLKWKPVEAERYLGFEWTSEYLWSERPNAPTDRISGGGYTALRFQFAQRFWIQARGALLGLPASDSPRTWRGEALVAFVPSEFSTLRLQYALEKAEGTSAPPIHEVFAQAIFSIGPHPTHAY